jgi:hypothetical protein
VEGVEENKMVKLEFIILIQARDIVGRICHNIYSFAVKQLVEEKKLGLEFSIKVMSFKKINYPFLISMYLLLI